MENEFKNGRAIVEVYISKCLCLMGSKTDNPMPEHSSDRELANEFVDFL